MKRFYCCHMAGFPLFLFIIFVLSAVLDMQAQPVRLDSLAAQLTIKYEQEIKTLPKENNKPLHKAYTKRYQDLQDKLERGDFYFDDQINPYFQGVFQRIIQANSTLDAANLHLLVSRYGYPNAFCRGDGTLVFNLELLRYLENEAQLAFVLCHEIAHQELNHVNNSLHERITKLYSKEMQRELKHLARTEYNTYEKKQNLLKGFVFEERSHSRLHETEADALAIQYMEKAGYSTIGGKECLAILDRVDEIQQNEFVDVKEVFNSSAYPFRDRWLPSDEGGFFSSSFKSDEQWNSDSLKTHPDCKKRIALLEKEISNSTISTVAELDNFTLVQERAQVERLYNAEFFKQLGQALFYGLLLQKEHPNDVEILVFIGQILQQIYTAQEEHKLREYLIRSNKEQPAALQDLLDVFWELRLKELAQMSFHYLNDRLVIDSESVDFISVHAFFKDIISE